jgi:hypothetical protein
LTPPLPRERPARAGGGAAAATTDVAARAASEAWSVLAGAARLASRAWAMRSEVGVLKEAAVLERDPLKPCLGEGCSAAPGPLA